MLEARIRKKVVYFFLRVNNDQIGSLKSAYPLWADSDAGQFAVDTKSLISCHIFTFCVITIFFLCNIESSSFL